MKLGVFERMKLASILPNVGNYRTLMAIQALRKELDFSVDEQKRLKFKGVLKCTSCGMTNVQFAQKIVDLWEKGNGKILEEYPTKPKLSQGLLKILNSQTCSACKAPMQVTGEVVWQRVKEKGKVVPLEKEVKISNKLTGLIAKALNVLEKKEKLQASLVSLYDKFIPFLPAELDVKPKSESGKKE